MWIFLLVTSLHILWHKEELFKVADQNGDGVVTMDELAMLLAVVVANGDPPFRKVTGPAVRLEAQLEELALFLFFFINFLPSFVW